jgi:hypothetical protein
MDGDAHQTASGMQPVSSEGAADNDTHTRTDASTPDLDARALVGMGAGMCVFVSECVCLCDL